MEIVKFEPEAKMPIPGTDSCHGSQDSMIIFGYASFGEKYPRDGILIDGVTYYGSRVLVFCVMYADDGGCEPRFVITDIKMVSQSAKYSPTLGIIHPEIEFSLREDVKNSIEEYYMSNEYVIVRPVKGHFNCPFYTPEGYSGGCIAPDPAQNKAWNGGMEKHGMYWIFDEAGMRKFMHDITGRDELPYKVGE